MFSSKKNLRYALTFLTTFLCLLSFSFYNTYSRFETTRCEVDFSQIPKGMFFPTDSFPENSVSQLKLDYLSVQENPDIGIIGNHVTQTFPSSSVAKFFPGMTVFNYSVPHVTLEEMVDLLLFLESRDALPRKHLLYGITDPNHGEGINVLGYQWRLPMSVYFSPEAIGARRVTHTASLIFDQLAQKFVEYIDWRNVAYSILGELDCRSGKFQDVGD